MNARAAILAGLLIVVLASAPALAAVSFTTSTSSGCSPLAVVFNDTTGSGMHDYNWSLGDGTTSTQRNLTYSYTFTGVGIAGYPVIHGINATGGGYSQITSTTIDVKNCAEDPIINPTQIDFANLSSLIGNIAGIFPGIVVLVISIVPLYIVQGLLYLILAFFVGLVASFATIWRR